MNGKPSALGEIREELRVPPPPEPHWTARVNADVLYQNRSITAQVCVKAAARMMAAELVAGHGDPDKAPELVEQIAERLMKAADRHIRGGVAKARRTKSKEISK
jgi:hypothetical protein